MSDKAAEMRDAEVPCLKTVEGLVAYIEALIEQEHEYDTCPYVISMAATAAFQYVAGRIGVTGFQASFADLDVLRRTRSLKCPFVIIVAEHEMYPQYDNLKLLQESRKSWIPWMREEAIKHLKRHDEGGSAAPRVVEHWKRLAAL